MNQIAEMNRIEQALGMEVLDEDEVLLVSGGNAALVVAAGVAAAFGALNAAEAFGEKSEKLYITPRIKNKTCCPEIGSMF